MPDFVRQKNQEKIESETPFQGGDSISALQRMIPFKFPSETFKGYALIPNTARPNATMKRSNQVAIQIAFYFRRNPEAGGNCDYSFLKGLRGAGAIVKLAFDVSECPRPHPLREFMHSRVNSQIVIITGANPEWWNPACVRAEHPVPCFPAHVLPLPNGRNRSAVGQQSQPTLSTQE